MPTCSSSWSRRRRRADARPTVITFDQHPDEVLMGVAPPLLLDPGGAPRAAGGRRRRGDRRPALRRGAAPDRRTTSSSSDPRAGRAARLPHDARRRVRLRACAGRRPPWPSSERATGSTSWSSRRSGSTARTVRSSAIRDVDRLGRPGCGESPARPAGDDHGLDRWRGRRPQPARFQAPGRPAARRRLPGPRRWHSR